MSVRQDEPMKFKAAIFEWYAKHDYWMKVAERQKKDSVTVKPNRGNILSCIRAAPSPFGCTFTRIFSCTSAAKASRPRPWMRWSTAKSKAEILQNASSPRRCGFSCPQPKVCRHPPKKPIHHGILGEEQLGGASADARSYWQGRFAACTFCWACLTNWSPDQQLGRCPKPHKGRCPLTLQGAIAP